MAIAWISRTRPNKVQVSEQESNIKELQKLLSSIRGNRIVLLEESFLALWLNQNLYDYADKAVILRYDNRQ
jgi:hypothetical protein